MQSVCIGGSRLKGFWGRFFWLQLGFWLQLSATLELLSVHRHHWSFSAFTVITGQLWLSSVRPLLPEGQRERKRRPADAERPGCAGCLAQSDELDRDERPHVGHPF